MNIFRLTRNSNINKQSAMPDESSQTPAEAAEDAGMTGAEAAPNNEEQAESTHELATPEIQVPAAAEPEIHEYLDRIEKRVAEIVEMPREAENAQLTELREMLEDFDTKMAKARDEICSRIHDEDVKCYRNIKGLVEELEQTIKVQKEENEELAEDNLRKIRKSFKGMKLFIAVIVIMVGLILVMQFVDIGSFFSQLKL